MSEIEGLAKFGLFLLLAFVLPGIVYIGFTILYYDVTLLESFGINIDSWVAFLGCSIFLGLVITSICFAIELLIFKLLKRLGKDLKRPEIIKIGVFEARNKNTFYLNQVIGQYICHFNIGIGVLLLTIIASILHDNTANVTIGKFLFGVFVSVINLYLSLGVFRDWSLKIIEKYEEMEGKWKGCAVIFDLDNTLVDTYQIYRDAKLKLAKEIRKAGGTVEAPEKLVEKIDQIDRKLCNKFKTSSYDPSHLVREICEITNCPRCKIEKLTKNYRKNIEKTPKLLSNVELVLEYLKEKGVYLILISEGAEEKKQKTLKKNSIEKTFDCTLFVEKNKERTYISTIKELKKQGYSYIYCVGDSLEKDIAPANTAGARTIWIPSKWEQPKNELERKVEPTYLSLIHI